jgi:hypothetical protein
MQQRGEERPVRGREGHCPGAEVALRHGQLMAEGEDFDVLVTIAHRQQP